MYKQITNFYTAKSIILALFPINCCQLTELELRIESVDRWYEETVYLQIRIIDSSVIRALQFVAKYIDRCLASLRSLQRCLQRQMVNKTKQDGLTKTVQQRQTCGVRGCPKGN